MGDRLAGLFLALCVLAAPLEASADSAAFKALQKQSNKLFKAGKYQQSLTLAQKLLPMGKKEFGDQHVQTAMLRNSIYAPIG